MTAAMLRALTWAEHLPAEEFGVLMAMAACANQDCEVEAGSRQMESIFGAPSRTIQRRLKNLESAGALVRSKALQHGFVRTVAASGVPPSGATEQADLGGRHGSLLYIYTELLSFLGVSLEEVDPGDNPNIRVTPDNNNTTSAGGRHGPSRKVFFEAFFESWDLPEVRKYRGLAGTLQSVASHKGAALEDWEAFVEHCKAAQTWGVYVLPWNCAERFAAWLQTREHSDSVVIPAHWAQ